jgi:glyoxylase-like metal-dependent hydrolase (beta-lactamase superfamily II)
MKITRRTAMGALLGTTAAAVGARFNPASAAAGVSGQQAPAFYRSKVGDIEITAISDGYGTFPKIEGFVRNATPEAVSAALAEGFMPTDRVQIPFTTLVVNTGGKLVLIDTGNGDLAAPTSGIWMKNFRAAGFTPDDVDMVVISHFHGDHVNGLRLKDGTAVFPKAEIKVSEPEFKFWMSDDNLAKAPDGLKNNFNVARRVFTPMAKDVTLYNWEKEVAPGITAHAAPGHTPGHTIFSINSGNASFMAVSDITNVPVLFVRNPDWAVMFDQDPDMARATRHRVLDMVSADKMQVGFYHANFPATGFITRDGGRYNLVPAAWKLPV